MTAPVTPGRCSPCPGWTYPFVCALLAAACATPLSRGSLEPRLTRRGVQAFRVLAQVGYSYNALACGLYDGREPEAHVIDNLRAYAALYDTWKLCWEPPAVDFERDVVVALLLPTAGCEAELVGFDLSADGRLAPHVALLGEMCNQVEVAQRFVAAVPRAALPAAGVDLVVAGARASARWTPRAGAVLPARVAKEAPHDPRTGGSPLSDVALPPRGEVRPERLPDGALYFVVHGVDGEPSAVSAWVRSPDLPEAPERPNVAGLFFPVRWSPDAGRFFSGWSFYDAHGVNVMGVHLPGLDALAVRRSGDRLLLFGPPAPARADWVSDPLSRRAFGRAPDGLDRYFDGQLVPLVRALEAQAGTWLVIDADVLRIGDEPRVLLCEHTDEPAERLARCRRDGAWIVDARVVPSIANPHADGGVVPDTLGAHPKLSVVAEGPVLARREERGFVRVHLFHYALRTEG